MKKKYVSLLVIIFIVVAILSGHWLMSEDEVFTDELALRKIFGNYNAQCDCAELIGVTSYYRPHKNQKYGELMFFKDASGNPGQDGDLNRHQVVLISNLEGGEKLVVTTSKSFDVKSGEILDCEGCGSWLSVGIFKKEKSKWILLDGAINLYGDGSRGMSPEIYINNKGSADWFEVIVAHYYFHHGEDDEAKIKLVYQKGEWASVNLLAKR